MQPHGGQQQADRNARVADPNLGACGCRETPDDRHGPQAVGKTKDREQQPGQIDREESRHCQQVLHVSVQIRADPWVPCALDARHPDVQKQKGQHADPRDALHPIRQLRIQG